MNASATESDARWPESPLLMPPAQTGEPARKLSYSLPRSNWSEKTGE